MAVEVGHLTRAELLREIQRLQALAHEVSEFSGQLSCEDLCPVVCAGPCQGHTVGPPPAVFGGLSGSSGAGA